MIYLLVTVKDRAIEAFKPCGVCRTEGEAIRVFKDILNNPETPESKHPDDYDLYILGTFDDQTGYLETEAKPRKIADGKTIKETLA